ncbi:flagellar hook-basal body protein [Teredinibacter franksiae]|uniref:flagellar hook-basal body protein n=1 Tax=Teredinibacter franksiae TaxID=2761453 RepID=UPI001627104A|nr:flagellar hook basal-body protein [Teredinibacter franksiae]
MIDAINIAKSGLTATQEWINTISHNLSNSQTTAYKKENVFFTDVVTTGDNAISSQNPVSSGQGTKIGSVKDIFTSGSFRQTGAMYDVAVQGKGLLEVELSNGDYAYTRVGGLGVDTDGRLGVVGQGGLTSNIYIPPDALEVQIDADGTVYATLSSGDVTELGMFQLAQFENESDLKSVGNGLYMVANDRLDPIMRNAGESGAGNLKQGYLETSNVDMVEEMTNLVLAQRAYQLNARLIQVVDSILETTNNIRR